ncbi:MAG: hypothetical protein VW405_10765 [Rhodospirillaceae bacterium]
MTPTKPFARVTLSPELTAIDAGLRRALASAHDDLASALPPGPYRTRALEAIEEAALWATKALSHSEVSHV